MACRTEKEFTWVEGSMKCTKTSTFFDKDNNKLNSATLVGDVNANECCDAGFDENDPLNKKTLLMACQQTFDWDATKTECSLISEKIDRSKDVDVGYSKEDCCQAFVDGDQGT